MEAHILNRPRAAIRIYQPHYRQVALRSFFSANSWYTYPVRAATLQARFKLLDERGGWLAAVWRLLAILSYRRQCCGGKTVQERCSQRREINRQKQE